MENPDTDTPYKFFDVWFQTCEETLSRLSGIPAVGPMREKSEKWMKGIPLFFDLYASWMDSISDFQNISLEAMNRMRDKTEGIRGELGAEYYKKFYDVWVDTYSETFKEFMRSEHFAQDMGKFLSRFIEMQKYNQELLEENYLRPMNLPTKTDIDELNKEVYLLKKKISELTRRINELSESR